jgi:MFS family permease
MDKNSTFDRREAVIDAPSRHEAGVSPRELRMVLIGLMMALALAALDQNIVATALPRITGDLGGFQHLSWVVTAFTVTSTVSAPLYGRLSDLYGRKAAFSVSILLFLVGSIACGLAGDLLQLILSLGWRRALEAWGPKLKPEDWVLGALGQGPYQHLINAIIASDGVLVLQLLHEPSIGAGESDGMRVLFAPQSLLVLQVGC